MGLIAPMSRQALEMSLYMAVVEDDHQAVRALKGTVVDACMQADGKLGEPTGTMLHYAVRHASLKTVIALLSIGADAGALDFEGQTPRQAAAERPAGGRMRSVLALWEKKKMSPAPAAMQDEDEFDFDDRAIAS